MKILIIVLSAILFSQVLFTTSFAELDAHTSQLVYAPGEPLFVYGFGNPNEQSSYVCMHQITQWQNSNKS